jgi:3',5'-cyclic AMP phosphodiesterase CpdA
MRRIAHISDLHFGAEDPAAVQALAADLQGWPYDLLVVSGDLTQRARHRQFRAAMDFLKRVNGRWLCVPGNHDIPLYDVVRRFLSPLGRYRQIVTPDLAPVFQDEQLLVAGLNSARPFSPTWNGFWKDGRLSREQLGRVEALAAPVPEALFKVVVTHHPFIPPPGERPHGIIRHAPRALATLEAVGVEVLLAGHLHLNYSGDVRTHHEATKRSILSVQAGTACSRRRRDEPNAYNRLTIQGAAFDGLAHDRLTVQVRRCDSGSTGFTDGARVVYEKRPGGWEQTQAQREDPGQ